MSCAGADAAKADHVTGAVDERGPELGRPMGFENGAAGLERCEARLEGVAGGPRTRSSAWRPPGTAGWRSAPSRSPGATRSRRSTPRRLRGLDGVKNDRVDAALMAEALGVGQYDPTRLATDEVRSLRSLTRYRQSPKAGLAEVKTQCLCLLGSYSPELPGAFSDVFEAAGRAAPSRSPPPSKVARRGADSLQRDISAAARGSRRVDGKAAELEALAKGSVGIRLGEGAAAMQVRSPVRQTDSLDGERAKAERRVRELLEPGEPLALAIPGVSYTAGARIVAETGDVARFRGAAALASYAGPNSSVNQPGRLGGGGGPITERGSPCLRRAPWLAASRACQYDPSLRAFYDRKRREGKCHRVEATAVARRLCHIVFAVMRDGAPYGPARPGRDPSKHPVSGSQGAGSDKTENEKS